MTIRLDPVHAYEGLPFGVKVITAFLLGCGMVATCWLVMDAIGVPTL